MDARRQTPAKHHWLLSHACEFLRWLFVLALVTAACGSFALYFVHSRLDEEIRLFVESKFQNHYPQLRVQVRSAHRVRGRGIEVRGLSITEPSRDGGSAPLVYIEELFAECGTELTNLAAGETHTKRLTLRGINLRATRFTDHTWSLDRLFPFPDFGGSPPINVEDGYVELVDISGQAKRVLSIRDVNLQLSPLVAADVAAHLNAPQAFQIRGSFSGDYLRRVTIAGHFSPARHICNLAGTVESLDLSRQSIDAMPEDLSRHLLPLRVATGMASFNYHLHASGEEGVPLACALAGNFTGRIEDPRLPQPLMNVRLPFEYNREGLLVRDATAQSGSTRLQLSARMARLERSSPFAVRLRAEHVLLDDQLAKSLPEDWRAQWDKFAPRGDVNAEVTIQFDGQQAKTALVLDLLDVSFAYEKFPYRVHHAVGQIRYEDQVLEVRDLRASANGRPLLVQGRLENLRQDPVGRLDLVVVDSLPIDQQLLDALQDESRDLVQSLHPHGALKLRFSFQRPDISQPPHKLLVLELLNCSLRDDRFPYPLHNVTGTLIQEDGEWTFRNLVGYNDSAFVTCNGTLRTAESGETLLALDFDATDVPLEDELREALTPGAQDVWHALRPRGTIDHLRILVRHESGQSETSISVTAQKNESEQNVEGRSITVKPTWLPYQLDEVTGSVRLHDGVLDLTQVRGMHGKTRVELTGQFSRPSPERWTLQFTDLTVRQLRTDHELIAALPPRLGRALARLSLEGAVSMHGIFGLEGMTGKQAPIGCFWSLDFDVEDGRLDSGISLEHIHGGLHLTGSLGGQGHYSRGTLDIDSLVYQGVQLTRVSGPLSIDDQHLAFGELIRRQQGEQIVSPLKANALDGVLVGSGRFWLNEEAWFELDGELFDGELRTITRELAPGGPDLSGKANARVRLVGGKGTHTLKGGGNVQLRDADIYDLPLMARLFKLLRVKPPDETAFTSSDIRFRIEADRIYFDQIDFNGDVINLNGRGEMNLDRTLNLVFDTSVVARDSAMDRLIRPLLPENGGLFQVSVTGTLDNPDVVRGVDQALQTVFPETPLPRRQGRSLLGVPLDFMNPFRSPSEAARR